jgi:hypothetical protein
LSITPDEFDVFQVSLCGKWGKVNPNLAPSTMSVTLMLIHDINAYAKYQLVEF